MNTYVQSQPRVLSLNELSSVSGGSYLGACATGAGAGGLAGGFIGNLPGAAVGALLGCGVGMLLQAL